MDIGHFYFIKDDYFTDFPDRYLMQNKETDNGQLHDRPCFFTYLDQSTQIYWMVPISSKLSKYKKIYRDKIARFGSCITIDFGFVLGYEKAFLIQNICPVIPKYIGGEYIDQNANTPVKVDGIFEKNLIQKVKTVLVLTKQGKVIVFPDILKIEQELLNDKKQN